jgi:4-carboxymuconolactone decarboxylase
MADQTTGVDAERRGRGKEVASVINGKDPDQVFDDLTTRFPGGLGELTIDFCFAEVWTRPALDRRTRSLLVVAALTALGHLTPLRTHVRGAIRHGASKEELREVFVQMAAYAGFPAATSAAEVAEEIMAEFPD